MNGEEIKDLVIPNSVTRIGSSAFAGCTDLTSVTIPNSVSSIGDAAFAGCENLLTVISLRESPAPITDNVFSEKTYQEGLLYVPVGTMAKYMVCDGWKNFVNKEEGIPSGISCVMFNTSETASYTLDGKRTTTRQRGINIVRMKDGSIRKIIVK